MPLAAGTRLGPYEILAALGAGGMGEVYRARDSRLDRIVAVKVLPEQFAGDPAFHERFEREARAVAALNHPHICTLHDIGEHAGAAFLVMEYLEGETLAARLAKGPVAFQQALGYAVQIADALDRAHRAGIVHRDLKPANVMLTKSGAKLLDFGLAKETSASAGGPGTPSMLATTPPNLTAQGTILGTFHYMSPEQLEGEDADARSDIFAFGIVLYEMFTGKKAFDGKTQASLFGAILRDTPPPVSSMTPALPPSIDRVVATCLEKDRHDRWQSARDLLRELKWIAEGTGSGAAGTAVPDPPRTRRSARLTWTLAAIAVLATTVSIALFVRGPSGKTEEALPVRFSIPSAQGFGLGAGTGQAYMALSPDGRRLAVVASRGGSNMLWIRSLDSLDATVIPGTENASFPFWSHDGRSLGFYAASTLKIVEASRGAVRVIADIPTGAGRGATWGADDQIVFPSQESGLAKISVAGGPQAAVTTPGLALGSADVHRFPVFLPDGRHIVYHAFPSNTLWLATVDGKSEPRRLTTADSQAAYVEPGWLLFLRQGTLMAQPFDSARLDVTGEAVPIVERVLADASGAGVFAASLTGVLAYRTGTLGALTQLTWFDRTGKKVGTVGEPGRYRNPELSPDGSRLAVEVVDEASRSQDIWLIDLARGVSSRFTFDPANDIYPVWSPDASRIMFGSDRNGAFSLYQKRADGSGTEERVFASTEGRDPATTAMAPYGWSVDGKFAIYRTTNGGVVNIGVLPLAGEDKSPRLFEASRFTQAFAQVSPSSRWIVYGSIESGRYEIYAQSFPTPGGGKWQISRDGAHLSRWRRDGRELVFYAADSKLVAVQTNDGSVLDVGAATPLFEGRLLNGPTVSTGFRQQFDLAPDGRRLLLNLPVEQAAPPSIVVVLNALAGLKR